MINKKSRICLYVKEEGGKNRVKLAKNWLNAYKKKGQMGPKRRHLKWLCFLGQATVYM